MCTMHGLGAGAAMPMNYTAASGGSNTTTASGSGAAALPAGGADLGAILTQLKSSFDALVQALGGNAQLGTIPPAPGAGEADGGGSAPQGAGGEASPLTEGAGAPPADKPANRAPKTYTVKRGDTLSTIAQRAGLKDWKELYELNKEAIGPDPNRLKVGTELRLPDGAGDVTAVQGRGAKGRGGTNPNRGPGNNSGNRTGDGNAGNAGDGNGTSSGSDGAGPSSGPRGEYLTNEELLARRQQFASDLRLAQAPVMSSSDPESVAAAQRSRELRIMEAGENYRFANRVANSRGI